MDVNAPKHTADTLLPLLVTLRAARQEALWQWKNCAGEHAHTWTMIIARLDERITKGEKALENYLDMVGFHLKKEGV